MPTTPRSRPSAVKTVRALVDAFYDFMDRDPDCAVIRAMHPEDLGESGQALRVSLRLAGRASALRRARTSAPADAPRAVPDRGGRRDQWLSCMTRAMDQLEIEGDLRAFLDARFAHVADFMRNR